MIYLITKYNNLELANLVIKQLKNLTLYYGDEDEVISSSVPNALLMVEKCLSYSALKQTHKEGSTFFSPFHGGQYAMFLYFLAKEIFTKRIDSILPEACSCLNQYLNSIFLNHMVNMPDVFYLDHPLGSVIGRAEIGNFFLCMQGCTIGASKGETRLVFPKLGEYVIMCANSSIFGCSKVGNNVVIAANACIKNEIIPDNSLVFGSSPNLIIKQYQEEEMKDRLQYYWKY